MRRTSLSPNIEYAEIITLNVYEAVVMAKTLCLMVK